MSQDIRTQPLLDPVVQAREDAELRRRTTRIARLHDVLRERMTEKQRAWKPGSIVETDPETADLPLVVRHALAFEKTLAEMPIVIEPDDLIVGNAVEDGRIVRTAMPDYATSEERDRAREDGTGIGAGLSHKTPYYYDVIGRGLAAILDDVDGRVRTLRQHPPSPERDADLAHFDAVRLECRAVIRMAYRYGNLAAEKARDTSLSLDRRHELSRIADVCRQVPENPARTFHEAVQSFWFVHYALFSTGTKLSCGRIDQYLNDALEADLESGRITIPESQELVDSLWLRFNDRAQICRENFFLSAEEAAEAKRSDGRVGGIVVDGGPKAGSVGHRIRYHFAEDSADAINHFGQNILLSGIRPDGSDGTNAVTYLCLNALEKFAFTSPVVTVRLHAGSPPDLLRRTAEVLRTGGGMPYLNNDDVLVQAYVDLGVSIEDARDYANSNCWETMIEGRSDQELLRGMNFLLFLELALRRGRSEMLGDLGPDTGDPRGFETFDRLMDAWKAQMDEQLRQGIDFIGDGLANGTLEQSSHGKHRCNPFLSAMTLDCIDRGKDVIRGGARYTIWHVMGEAVSNATDAMAAVRKLVYEDRTLSMDDLLAALDDNWAGHENLRQRILARCPRFGNNDPEADDLAREMMDFFVERTRHHAARHPDVIFPTSVGTFSWYAKIGKEVGATPDGRRSGEPIAANFSPAVGADTTGPTAAIGSHLAMPVSALAAGAPIDLRLSASSLKGRPGIDRLVGLVDTFIALGGNMLTLTVTDVEELKRALEDPDSYRHLRVRMGGWSAYFVMLGKVQQELHIQRVEHGLV